VPVRHRPPRAAARHRRLVRVLPRVAVSLDRAGAPGADGIRIEDYTEEGRYVVRAEPPGIDPDQDLDITVDEHVLRIHAERSEERKDKPHCEFRYGSFTRSVPLPVGAKEDEINANYDNGILTVTIPVEEGAQTGRRMPVQRGLPDAARRDPSTHPGAAPSAAAWTGGPPRESVACSRRRGERISRSRRAAARDARGCAVRPAPPSPVDAPARG